MSASVEYDENKPMVGDGSEGSITSKFNEKECIPYFLPSRTISTEIAPLSYLMSLPHGTIVDFSGVVANVGPVDNAFDTLWPDNSRDLTFMDICGDIGFILISNDQEKFCGETLMNAEIGRSIFVARFLEVDKVTNGLVSTHKTTFVFPLSPATRYYAPLEDIRHLLLHDINSHDRIKNSLRRRNITREINS